jgi:glutaredoxin
MTIEIYTMENCGYCQESKKLLTENNYNYIEHVLNEDSIDMILYLQKRLNTEQIILPITFIEDTSIVGYFRLADFISKTNLFETGARI